MGDAVVNGSETGTSFKQALYFMECGFFLHDTMIFEKHNFSSPAKGRYHQLFEYMFVFSKGKPKVFNPLIDKTNRYAGTGTYGKNTRRQKDGTMKEMPKNVIAEFGMRGNVWKYIVGSASNDDTIAFEHPAIFPENLARDHIYTWSNEGDLVYDPFGGSGTTAKEAHKQKRSWIISEISEEYVNIATNRLKPHLTVMQLF